MTNYYKMTNSLIRQTVYSKLINQSGWSRIKREQLCLGYNNSKYAGKQSVYIVIVERANYTYG